MKHSRAKSLLYEYVRGELPAQEMAGIEDHLVSCRRCAREAVELRAAVNLTVGGISRASDQRSPEYWNNFAVSVERRIQSPGPRRTPRPVNLLDAIAAFFTLRPRAIGVLGSGLAVVVLALVLFRMFHVGPEQREQPGEAAHIVKEPAQAIPVDDRMGDYLRKSKVLLVGIAHMNANEDQPIDLSRESEVSRELLNHARYFKNQPLDIRSARLIDDLQKILVELANIKERNGLPNVDIIRSGIHRQNLLFKIRMAEALCDSTRFIPVRDTY